MNPDNYVSYPIALALKKAGFDEPCHYGYSVKMRLEPEISFGEPKMVHSKTPKNYNDNRKGIAKGLEFCSAVPLWQAQKWLRDIRKIDIELRVWFVGDTREYRPYIMPPKKHDFIAYPPEKSYESALSAGIAAALELIDNENV